VAVVEQSPRAEGRTVSLVLSPKAQQSARPTHKVGAEKGPADGAAPAS